MLENFHSEEQENVWRRKPTPCYMSWTLKNRRRGFPLWGSGPEARVATQDAWTYGARRSRWRHGSFVQAPRRLRMGRAVVGPVEYEGDWRIGGARADEFLESVAIKRVSGGVDPSGRGDSSLLSASPLSGETLTVSTLYGPNQTRHLVMGITGPEARAPKRAGRWEMDRSNRCGLCNCEIEIGARASILRIYPS